MKYTRQQDRFHTRKGYKQEQGPTRIQTEIARLAAKGPAHLRAALSNFSRHPNGKERTKAPRTSIWPEGKTAKPGRMG